MFVVFSKKIENDRLVRCKLNDKWSGSLERQRYSQSGLDI